MHKHLLSVFIESTINAVEPYPFLCYNKRKENIVEVFPRSVKSVKTDISYPKRQNEQFQTRIKTFTGWAAQIIQHEIDHCEGILI